MAPRGRPRAPSISIVLALGTGVGGGLVLDGRLYRGWAELGHVVVDADGPPCQGNCHGRGHLEAVASGEAAERAAASSAGGEADAHRLVARGAGRAMPARVAALERDRPLPRRSRSARSSNIFAPDVVVVGGGFGIAAWDLLREPAPRRRAREALAAGRRDAPDRPGRARRRRRPRRRRARRLRGARRGAVRRVPLVVCATPIGNLARRHAPRARRARATRTRSSARTRRRTQILLDRHEIRARRLVSVPPAQRGAGASPSCCRGSRPASAWRSSRTPGCPVSTIRVGGSSAAAIAAGVDGDGPSGAERRRDGARRERPRGARSTGSSATCRGGTRAGRALGGGARWPHAAVAFESPKRLAATRSRASPRADPDRPVAVCRELTKRFEEVVRGTAAELAERLRGGRSRAR